MPLTEFLPALLLGFACGLIAAIYRGVLAYEEPFSAWWRFGSRFEDRWFFKPVWGCAKCFAGQLALWTYLFRAFRLTGSARFPCFLALSFQSEGYSIIGHLFAIAAAIFTALILSPIIDNK